MGRKSKLARFAAIKSFANVFENMNAAHPQLRSGQGEMVDYRGRWSGAHFPGSLPLTMELACGKGEYTRGLAQRYPQRAFIGMDIKGARIWKGAKAALEANMPNVAFIRSRIEFLGHYFAPGEIAEIWITFPDPFLEKSRIKKRLTSGRFLSLYTHILRPGGLVHLKTDDPILFQFSVDTLHAQTGWEILQVQPDIYSQPSLAHPDLDITTFYEQMHLAAGRRINYLCAQFIG